MLTVDFSGEAELGRAGITLTDPENQASAVGGQRSNVGQGKVAHGTGQSLCCEPADEGHRIEESPAS